MEIPNKKYVVKRDGTQSEINMLRIKERLQGLTSGLNMDYINLDVVTEKVFKGIYNGKFFKTNNFLHLSF